MPSLSMTLSDPWPGFQGHGSFKRRVSPKRRILQTQLLYRTLIGNHRQAISISKLAIQLTTPLLLHINRANVSQASRGFVSDSWPFLFIVLVGVRIRRVSKHIRDDRSTFHWAFFVFRWSRRILARFNFEQTWTHLHFSSTAAAGFGSFIAAAGCAFHNQKQLAESFTEL